jgi:hypothetical protein
MPALQRPRITHHGRATSGKRHARHCHQPCPEQTHKRINSLLTLHWLLLIGHAASTSSPGHRGERGVE